MSGLRSATAMVCLMAILPSCSWLKSYAKATPEEPTATHETYLQGGPSTDIELGSGERTLLEDYKLLNDTKLALDAKLDEVRAENRQLRSQLGQTEKERDAFRNHHAGAEQESERVGQRAQQLESKVLSLTIENTMLEQELLRHRIASLKRQYEDIVSTQNGTGAAPMSGGMQR